MLSTKEFIFSNCGAREDSWESLGWQGDQISNQSILKKINPEYSPNRLILKLKLPKFGNLMQTANSLEKTLMLGKKEEGVAEIRYHHWLGEHELSIQWDSGRQGRLVCCSPWGHKESDMTEWLNNDSQEYVKNSDKATVKITT